MKRLVYLSPVPWASFAQRPHRFVEWFRRATGGRVLWLEPYPARFPSLRDCRRFMTVSTDAVFAQHPSWLTVIRPPSLPIEPLPGSSLVHGFLWKRVLGIFDELVQKDECLIVIGKPSELAVQLLYRYPGIPAVYDAMDNFPAFHKGLARSSMARREHVIAGKVSKILVSSTLLADRFSDFYSKVSITLNACDIESLPDGDINGAKRPVLGYVGTISDWFDWGLVKKLAEVNPSVCIRLIGPIHAAAPGRMPDNIEVLPACDHASAIRAMQEFSVGLIPFVQNELTASVDPIKYYEYRALGLPVISTRFGEMALRENLPGLFYSDTESDLQKLVQKALSWHNNEGEIRKFRSENSWNARFDGSNITQLL